MQENIENTYTGLFRLAQKWFADNPHKQMDRKAWWDKVYQTSSVMTEKAIYAGGYEVTNATGDTIPVLAAISLGLPSEELAQVINHHGIKLEHISNCIFAESSNSPVPDGLDSAKYLSIDGWRVTSEVVKAMSETPALSEGLAEEVSGYEDYSDLDIARLLSSNEDFWPVTQVREILAAKSATSSKISSIQPYFTDIHSFSYTNANFEDFTDEQLLTLLERSGYLEIGVNVENGFKCGLHQAFFNNLFLGMNAKDNKNHERLINALNAVDDPGKITLIAERLMEALPDYLFEQDGDGVKIIGLMEQYLDLNKYGSVIDNMTVKLNVLPLISTTGAFGTLDTDALPACFQDFVRSEATILKRLFDQIINLDPSTFRHSHFSAIAQAIDTFDAPQDIVGIDLPLLMKKVLLALDAYAEKTHYTLVGSTTPKYIDEARIDVATLVNFASKQKDLDYSRLQDLPSASKAFLASNGFDIKKLPGMSYKDKGRVLDDGMGL